MILAKFSGSGSSTMTITVISDDSTSGARIISTSTGRRSMIEQDRRDRKQRQHCRLSEGADNGFERCGSTVTAAPPAPGATAVTCWTKARSPALLRALGCGRTWMRAWPSGVTQSCEVLRQGREGDRLRRERGAQAVEFGRQEADESRIRRHELGIRLAGELGQVVADPQQRTGRRQMAAGRLDFLLGGSRRDADIARRHRRGGTGGSG